MIRPYTFWSNTRPACARADGTVRYSEHEVSLFLALAAQCLPTRTPDDLLAGFCRADRRTVSAGTAWVFARELEARRERESRRAVDSRPPILTVVA